jgi:S-adenosylmethionine synthetase
MTTFMTSPKLLFTSESVTEGHPDKICDQISDAIVDACLEKDPASRVAIETAVKTGIVMLLGELTTEAFLDFDVLVREVITGIGFDDSDVGFDGNTCGVILAIANQSPDIDRGVSKSLEARRGEITDEEVDSLGAGDQGMMFGFACNETDVYMPMPIFLAHKLTRRLAQVRREGILDWVRPDGKAQVTVEYEYGKPKRVDTVLVSTQHTDQVGEEEVRDGVIQHVIHSVLPPDMVDDDLKIHVNPTGRFVVGGPKGDAGLTGRKIIVDTYGGMGRHGGGCFSGKDPTKVDRSGAYAARWAAKNVVASGLADRCEIQVAYAIGVSHPLSINVETFGTGKLPDDDISRLIEEHFDLRPGAIIRALGLRRPIFRQVSNYGHFGREDLDVPWERLDKVEALRQAAGLQLASA